MKYHYEMISKDKGLPIKIFIHSVDKIAMHLHKEIEVILIAEGSINIIIENEKYLLKEDDIMIVNSNEIHSTSRTEEGNALIALQIDPIYYSRYYEGLNRLQFCCRSSEESEDKEDEFNNIRKHLLEILLENYKKTRGYKFILASEVNILLYRLLNKFNCSLIDKDRIINIKNDMRRIERIIAYIDQNYQKKIELKDIASNEFLSPHYISHFIKDMLGISFQEYLNLKRLDRFIELLTTTDKTITDISYESGFPSTKSLNRLFKLKYNCSPSEYKRNYSEKSLESQEDNFLYRDKEEAYKKLEIYLKELNKKIESAKQK